MRNYNGLGERIKNRREEVRKTQRAVAKKIGLTAQQLCRIENGSSGTTYAVLIALAQELDVSAEWLAGAPTVVNQSQSPQMQDAEWVELTKEAAKKSPEKLAAIKHALRAMLAALGLLLILCPGQASAKPAITSDNVYYRRLRRPFFLLVQLMHSFTRRTEPRGATCFSLISLSVT